MNLTRLAPGLVDHFWQSTVVACLALLVLALVGDHVSARVRRLVAWLALAKFAVPTGFLFAGHSGSPMAGVISLPDALRLPLAASAGPRADPQAWPGVAVLAWALGAVALITYAALRWAKKEEEIIAAPKAPAGLQDRIAAAAQAAGLPRAPVGRTIPAETSPAVFGHRPAALLLPSGLETVLEADEIDTVLLHECLHLARRDNLWSGVQTFVLAVAWFHPLAWVLSRRIQLETEMACDEAVLARGVAPDRYVAALAKTVRHAIGLLPPDAAAAGATPLGLRLGNILRYGAHRPSRWFGIPAVATIVAGAALSGYAGSLAMAGPSVESRPSGSAGGWAADGRSNRHFLAVNLVGPDEAAEPTIILRPLPEYPALLRRAGVSGQAIVEFTVDTDGRVRNPVLDDYDEDQFAAAATLAVLQWRYQPARVGGQAVESHQKFRILFRALPLPESASTDTRPVHVYLQPM